MMNFLPSHQINKNIIPIGDSANLIIMLKRQISDQNKKIKISKKKKSCNGGDNSKGTSINMLDDDCLVKIFMYLPVQKRLEIEQVCTRWQAVIKDAWYDIKKLDYLNSDTVEVELTDQSLTQPDLEKMLIRCGRYLKDLQLSDDYDSQILNVIRDNCQNLLKLKLELTTYSDDNFILAFKNMDKLKSIKIKFSGDILLNCLQCIHKEIENIQFIARDIYHYDSRFHTKFKALLSKFKCLRNLSMNRLEVSNKTIKIIGQMENLIKLDLKNCFYNRKTSLMPLINLGCLEYLDLSGCHIGNDVDDLIDGLADNCVNIKYFDISWNLSVTQRGLINIRKMKNLEELHMNHLSLNVNEQLGPFDKLKKLECNDFIGGVDNIIMGLIINCPHLDNFDVRNTRVTIETVIHAINVTKNRKNNVILYLHVSRSVIEDYHDSLLENTSPLLVIKCH